MQPKINHSRVVTIQDWFSELGLTIAEEIISLEFINEMDEAFISSTGIGLLPCYWDGWQSDFTITLALKQNLDQFISTT